MKNTIASKLLVGILFFFFSFFQIFYGYGFYIYTRMCVSRIIV